MRSAVELRSHRLERATAVARWVKASPSPISYEPKPPKWRDYRVGLKAWSTPCVEILWDWSWRPVRNPDIPTEPSISEIIKRVAAFYSVTPIEIRSNRKHGAIMRPRHVAMYLARQLTGKSLPEIGFRFGRKDHTTIMHAVSKISGMLPSDAKLSAEIDELINLLSMSEDSCNERRSAHVT